MKFLKKEETLKVLRTLKEQVYQFDDYFFLCNEFRNQLCKFRKENISKRFEADINKLFFFKRPTKDNYPLCDETSKYILWEYIMVGDKKEINEEKARYVQEIIERIQQDEIKFIN